MAPEIRVAPAVHVVVVAVQTSGAEAWESELARKASKALRQPHKAPEEIVDDLLARLKSLRQRRELGGLNHWVEYAPTYLQRMLVRHEALRRRAVEAYIRAEKANALARAEVILGGRCDAEDAVAEACIRLFKGKTGPAHFYRLLSHVCIWRKRARRNAAKFFSPERDLKMTGEEQTWKDTACGELSAGDPMEILLREEAIREGIRAVKTDWKHRRVRELKWWAELVSHYCPEENVGKEPPQAYI